MEHTIVLEIPDTIYEPLVQRAMQIGATPEAVAVEWLKAASTRAVEDPLEAFIGAISSGPADWADEHDKYLGQALMEELKDKQGQ